MKRRMRVFAMVAISFGMAFSAQADPPELMNHQGLLMTATGTVVPDGDYGLRFRICTGPVGENCTWQQDMSVQVKNGVYSVLLSAAGLADQFQQPITYLEVAITDAPPEAGIGTLPLVMTPRQQIASVAYAFSAASLEFAGGTGPFCIFSKSCATGWTDRGWAGIILHDSYPCPYDAGGAYNSDWDWCHPRLCCID